jgi:2-amino-4-hydroxy-6-hydroxymethyldihydropteridine diphosphokinase
VRASLADQSIAIALGANLGDPARTLIALRPLLEQALTDWLNAPEPAGQHPSSSRWVNQWTSRWSPLFRTEPVGGPAGQPSYLNAVVVFTLSAPPANTGDCATNEETVNAAINEPRRALTLLKILQLLEAQFGRQRQERWGARSLDLDLLWCGDLCGTFGDLQLPHPRLLERSFVLAPLAAVDPHLIPPGQTTPRQQSCANWLAQLLPELPEAPPERLPPQQSWPE